jgi:hypothetical protein
VSVEDILSNALDKNALAFSANGASSTRSGSTLFVINLCASMAPVPVPGKSLPGLETYRLYQVARVEDGRPRHRLRLGFFKTEMDAEGVLETVRARYPTAFTTCLSDDDRKFARGFLPPSMHDASDTALVRSLNAVLDAAPEPVSAAPARVAPTKALAPAVMEVTRKAEEPITIAPRQSKHKSPQLEPVAPEFDINEMTWSPDAPPPLGAAPIKPIPIKVTAAKPASSSTATTTASGSATATTGAHIALPAAKIVTAKGPAFQPHVAPRVASAPKASPPASKSAELPPKKNLTAAPLPPQTTPNIKPPSTAPLNLTAQTAPAKATAPLKPSTEPFRVDRGISIPQTGLSLESDARTAPATTAPAVGKTPASGAAVSATARPTPAPPVTKPAATPAQARQAPGTPHAKTPAPSLAASAPAIKPGAQDLDSTQTIRALTSAELNDANQPKWFVVQLAISEQAINLDTMPHLDIFTAYRLYSVATAGSGKILHSLRLGFFKEEVSAQAVAGYLKTFFASPSVIRIAVSEQTRFADAIMPNITADAAPKPAPSQKVIELSEVRDRIGKALDVPTVTMAIESPHASKKPAAAKTAARPPIRTTHAKKSSSRASTSGKHRTLNESLMEEARQVRLSESAIRKLPKNDSLLSKLVDKLKK